jgi:TetR/AcrR family transcriptional repressor of nem operon
VRKSRQETTVTRARIVTAAAAQFREHGIAATGLADLMGAAGMTHGGFYKHFASKEDVVREAAQFALAERRHAFEVYARAQPPGEELEALVTAYLSMDHCLNRSGGCLMAALGSEIVRAPDTTKALAMEQFLAFVALIEDLLGPRHQVDRHGIAVTIASTLIGALTMARIAPAPDLAEPILAGARTHVLANWA